MPREAADQTPEPQQFPSAAVASMGSTLNSALARCLLATLAMASSGSVLAQTDEIQVYDAGIAPIGVFALTWHNNFTASGARAPANPGGVVPNHSLNGVTEWAYGVTHWFEAGLYLPLYTATSDGAVLVGRLQAADAAGEPRRGAYDDFGPLRHFYASAQQSHQLFAVLDYRTASSLTLEAGVGFGLAGATDHRVLKLILTRDLNAPHTP